MSAMDIPRQPGRPMTGRHALAMIVVFFVVVIGVDVTFMVMAIRTDPGAVSVTPYEDGLVYNRRIVQLEAQARLGWTAAAAARPGLVVVILHDRNGQTVEGLEIAGKLERTATEAGRLTAGFKETAPGRYEAPVGALAGAWDLTAEARLGGRPVFTAERRLTWP